MDFVSFALEFHELNIKIKLKIKPPESFLRRVNFDIMLSSAITKRAVFTRWRVLKRRRYFIFVQGHCHDNMLYNIFTLDISGTVSDHAKFYP